MNSIMGEGEPINANVAGVGSIEFKDFAHKLRLIEKFGHKLKHDCVVLDFGCGDGVNVNKIIAAGYSNVYGYDVIDCISSSVDRSRIRIDSNGLLPFENGMFDLVLSDQVFEHVIDQKKAFSEILRVLKPGGAAIHIIPAKYQLIEPHLKVPLGGLISARWYYKFWALTGIRNEFQVGLGADDVTEKNCCFYISGLRYIENSCYRALWATIGYSFKFVEQEYLETSDRRKYKLIAKITHLVPSFWWIFRTFHMRIVYMRKPDT